MLYEFGDDHVDVTVPVAGNHWTLRIKPVSNIEPALSGRFEATQPFEALAQFAVFEPVGAVLSGDKWTLYKGPHVVGKVEVL